MFEQAFKNIDDVLWKEAGCTTAPAHSRHQPGRAAEDWRPHLRRRVRLGALPVRILRLWFYQLNPGRNLGKTNPLNDDDLAEFVKLQKTFADSPRSWSVDTKTIDPATFDLSVKNPNGSEEIVHRSPEKIRQEIAALDAESAEVLAGIRKLL